MYTVLGLAICLCPFISFKALFLCRPLTYTWDKTLSGNCTNLKSTILSQVAVNIFIDIAIVVLPMKELWGLQMPLVRKLGVGFMYSVGVGYVSLKPNVIWFFPFKASIS